MMMMMMMGKLKFSKKNPPHWHFVHHKFHTDWPGIKPRLPWWDTSN
jgi:hypothetical protein